MDLALIRKQLLQLDQAILNNESDSLLRDRVAEMLAQWGDRRDADPHRRSDREEDILRVLTNRRRLTSLEIAGKLGLSVEQIEPLLVDLAKAKLLRRKFSLGYSDKDAFPFWWLDDAGQTYLVDYRLGDS